MIFKLPGDMVDRFFAFYLFCDGYTRLREEGMIKYRHPQYGKACLRFLDDFSCEVLFFPPAYPTIAEVYTEHDVSIIEALKAIQEEEYPESVIHKMMEEHRRRVTEHRHTVNFLCKGLKREEALIRQLAAREFRNLAAGTIQPEEPQAAEAAADQGQPAAHPEQPASVTDPLEPHPPLKIFRLPRGRKKLDDAIIREVLQEWANAQTRMNKQTFCFKTHISISTLDRYIQSGVQRGLATLENGEVIMQ